MRVILVNEEMLTRDEDNFQHGGRPEVCECVVESRRWLLLLSLITSRSFTVLFRPKKMFACKLLCVLAGDSLYSTFLTMGTFLAQPSLFVLACRGLADVDSSPVSMSDGWRSETRHGKRWFSSWRQSRNLNLIRSSTQHNFKERVPL